MRLQHPSLALQLLREVYDWFQGNPKVGSPYLRARLAMRMAAARFNLSERLIAKDPNERARVAEFLRDIDFLSVVRWINERLPKDVIPPYNGILAAAVLGDVASIKEFYAMLVQADADFRDKGCVSHGTDGLANEPIASLFIHHLFP